MNYVVPLGPLTAIAIADAFACGFEFAHPMPLDILKTDVRYRDHTMWPFLPAGSYSDDTQRALALSRAILDREFTTLGIRKYLVEAYALDPRGYSKRMLAAYGLSLESDGYLPVSLKKGDSAGGAMAASIVAVVADDVQEALDLARLQAETTHDGDGVLAAQIAAAMAVFVSRGVGLPELRAELRKLWPKEDRLLVTESKTKPGNKGMDCVLVALECLEASTSLLNLLLRCVARGGDTDTVAAIAMGAGWCCKSLANDLPYQLWYGLENGPYGRSYLRKIEMELLRRYSGTLRVG